MKSTEMDVAEPFAYLDVNLWPFVEPCLQRLECSCLLGDINPQGTTFEPLGTAARHLKTGLLRDVERRQAAEYSPLLSRASPGLRSQSLFLHYMGKNRLLRVKLGDISS